MPKETVKQRKEREKAERVAAAQSAERVGCEGEEDKGRQWVELTERLERLETSLDHYERLTTPSSRLMVWRTEYDDIRRKMQTEGGLSAERILAMQKKVYETERHHAQLLQEFVHLRTEFKRLASQVSKSTEQLHLAVSRRLTDCVDAIEGAIHRHRSDAVECAQHLHLALDQSRVQAAELARASLHAVQKLNSTLQENTSMHTRLPHRIRAELQSLSKEELLLMLDTLSFEDSALHHLLYRFPPAEDDPFASADAAADAAARRPKA